MIGRLFVLYSVHAVPPELVRAPADHKMSSFIGRINQDDEHATRFVWIQLFAEGSCSAS